MMKFAVLSHTAQGAHKAWRKTIFQGLCSLEKLICFDKKSCHDANVIYYKFACMYVCYVYYDARFVAKDVKRILVHMHPY